MGAAAAPLIGAGATIFSGMMNNNAQQHAADSAAAQQQQLLDMQKAIFNTINNVRMAGEQQGLFDPQKRMDMIDKQDAHFENLDLGNQAGALRVAGYRPGDSEYGIRNDAIANKHQVYRDQQYAQAISQAFNDHLNAITAANGNMLNPGIQAAQQNRMLALGSMQNPAGFFSSIMPLLSKLGGGNGDTGSGNSGGSGGNTNYYGGNTNGYSGGGMTGNYDGSGDEGVDG
jgi:hypothetical protein